MPVPKQDQALETMGNTDVFACPATDMTHSYYTALLRLPIAFYYNALTDIILTGEVVKQRSFPPSVLPIADAASLLRRSTHDSFRPPLGQPTYYLFGIGYGKEVGLPEGMHEVYDPSSKKSLILDHTAFKIFLEDPRPGKRAPIFVQPTVVTLGNTASNMPYSLCTDVAIVQEAAQRAHSKPVGCTLSARGQNGQPGVNGNVGSTGANGRNEMEGDTGFLRIGAKGTGKHGKDGEHGGRGGNGGRGASGSNGDDVIVTLSGSEDELKVAGSKEFKVRLGGVKSEQVLLVDCRGGDGGRGGQGGRGGAGGNGDNGGDGVLGASSYTPGGNGGNGGNGGDGGDGAGVMGGKVAMQVMVVMLEMVVAA